VDPCGAGDAFLAAFSLGDRSQPEESLKIANIWGALSTTIHGTIPPQKAELLKILNKK
jgi:sugar/nucleoside kinase (ribokinase family)